jgi:hypothetical protein
MWLTTADRAVADIRFALAGRVPARIRGSTALDAMSFLAILTCRKKFHIHLPEPVELPVIRSQFMTVRERWTVYPLLFLAIMIAARSELFPSQRSKFRAIDCQELRVTNVNGEPLVHIGESPDQSGVVVVYGPLPGRGSNGPIPVQAAKGQPLKNQTKPASVRSPVAELRSDESGGTLRLWSTPDRPTLLVGHHAGEHLSGLMAEDQTDQLIDSQKQFRGQFWGTQITWDDFEEGGE